MIVAIDGTAGSGKSSVADMIAHRFDFININSGNLYRAVAFCALDKKVDVNDKKAIKDLLDKTSIKYIDANCVQIDKKKVSNDELHTIEIDSNVGTVSNYIFVREKVNKILNDFAKGKNVVCEGRDIGSVVFPKAECKIYMDADVRERAYRRATQYGVERDKIISDLIIRDKEDKERECGGLILASGATKIDTTSMTMDEVYKKVAFLVKERMQNK